MVTRPTHYNTRYKFDLSPRQREVLDLISRGRTNAEIADALGVSLDGAKYHVREILAKLALESREDAAHYWSQYNRPTAKLGRAFGSVFGLGALKTALGAGAVVAAGAALAGIVVAINASGGSDSNSGSPIGDDDPPPTTTPVVTPTPSTPSVETPEEFAERISQLVTTGNVAGLLGLAEPQTFTCPGPVPNGAGGPYPLCDGASPGEQRQGYVVARDASEATTIASAGFTDVLTQAISPSMTLASIGTGPDGTLLVGFATGRAPEALYLAFRTAPDAPAQLTSLGVSGANAATILSGGDTITVVGPTTFKKAG